jgi:hypothetical protein
MSATRTGGAPCIPERGIPARAAKKSPPPPLQFLSQSLVAAVFVATILLGAVSEPAQAQGPGDRSSFTGFFYVSSIRGDDALAASLNPGGSGKSKKMLMHAPGSATPIGVAIVDDDEEHPATPVIVNNTFAENRISIWSGSSLTGGSTGWAHPRILNNVIDSYCARTGASLSCFEGVFADDLVVGGASNWRTYNAWDGPFSSGAIYGRANLGATIAGWPVTATRTSSIGSGFGPWPAFTPIPGVVDISVFTGASGSTRGILFLRGLFQRALTADHCPHDYRLSPHAWQWDANVGDHVPVTSPLLNAGTTSLPLSYRNGASILHAPGLTGPGSTSADDMQFCSVHAWDLDAEGMGNPRVANRVDGDPLVIDLGADECDELIMAGFVPHTRIFSRNVPNAPLVTDHTTIYFVDDPGATRARPSCTLVLAPSWTLSNPQVDFRWWQQAQVNPVPHVLGSNYTRGVPVGPSSWPFRTYMRLAAPSTPPFMRNLACDFSPHLITDAHPFWGQWFHDVFAHSQHNYWSVVGPFATNPWFSLPDFTSLNPNTYTHHGPQSPNNHNLYYNPMPGADPDARPLAATFLGVLNPPGAWDVSDSSPGAFFLWPGVPPGDLRPSLCRWYESLQRRCKRFRRCRGPGHRSGLCVARTESQLSDSTGCVME